MTLAELINAGIEAKQGDKAFALFYEPTDEGGTDWLPWSVMIGNPAGPSTVKLSWDQASSVRARGIALLRTVRRRIWRKVSNSATVQPTDPLGNNQLQQSVRADDRPTRPALGDKLGAVIKP